MLKPSERRGIENDRTSFEALYDPRRETAAAVFRPPGS
jgi:hypothetical protein